MSVVNTLAVELARQVYGCGEKDYFLNQAGG